MKTCLYNFNPLKPHFYIVKLEFTGVYIIFLIFAQNHRLWVLVRTIMYVLNRNMKISDCLSGNFHFFYYFFFFLFYFVFLGVVKLSVYLKRHVSMMTRNTGFKSGYRESFVSVLNILKMCLLLKETHCSP